MRKNFITKDKVIEAIDKLIDLENQKQHILQDYQDVIIDYVKDYDSPHELFFENCDYIRDLLLKAKENVINYWDEELNESVEENSSSAQEIRDTIYSMLMTHSDYFKKDFGGQFDSDDDVEMTIDEIVNNVKNGQEIEYVKQPSYDFAERLQSLVKEYIRAGGRDDIIAQDGI